MEKTTLFAVAYAGGSAKATFSKWSKHLGDEIEVLPLEFAGHGHRMSEPSPSNVEEIVEDLMQTIRPVVQSNQAYAFYGHSMGCVVVYELVKRMSEEGFEPPKALFLSARRSPDTLPTTHYHALSDEQFLQEIKMIGGTPSHFFDNPLLVDAFLPVLRNDYRIIEQYRVNEPVHISSADIHFFLSDADSMVSDTTVRGWERFTQGQVYVYNFSGGHFFINDCYRDISRIVRAKVFKRRERIIA